MLFVYCKYDQLAKDMLQWVKPRLTAQLCLQGRQVITGLNKDIHCSFTRASLAGGTKLRGKIRRILK